LANVKGPAAVLQGANRTGNSTGITRALPKSAQVEQLASAGCRRHIRYTGDELSDLITKADTANRLNSTGSGRRIELSQNADLVKSVIDPVRWSQNTHFLGYDGASVDRSAKAVQRARSLHAACRVVI